jgi:hypothetical protein
VADDEKRGGHLKRRPNFVHMAVGLVLVTSVISLDLQLVSGLDLPALVAIIFFNYLFVFLLFPLEGPLSRKIVLLLVGNSVGFVWYIIQVSFLDVFSFLNTETFRIVFLVAKPLIDFVWIVAVWSLSLSVMTSYKIKMEGLEKG